MDMSLYFDYEDPYEEMYGNPCNMALWYDLDKVAGDCILPACLRPQQEEGEEKPLRRVLRAMKKNPVELSWVSDYLGLLCHDHQVQQELQQLEKEEEENEAKSKSHDDQHLLNPGLLCNDQQQQEEEEKEAKCNDQQQEEEKEAKSESMNVRRRPIIRFVRKRPEDVIKPGFPCNDDRQQQEEVKEAKQMNVVKRPVIKIVKKSPDQELLKPGLLRNDQQQQVQVKDAKPKKMNVHVVKRPIIEIVRRKRQEDDEAGKLESRTEKLHESYQRIAEAKKRRMIQVVEHQDIVQVPKPKPKPKPKKPMTKLAKKCLGDRKKMYASLATKRLGDRKMLYKL